MSLASVTPTTQHAAPVRKTITLLLVLSCAPRPHTAVDGGAEAPVAVADAGWRLTPVALDAWLGWQVAMAGQKSVADGGLPRLLAMRRARFEAQRLADAGLTFDEVDRIEAIVAVAVTEWNLERLAGAGERSRFNAALVGLSEAQRAQAEAALGGSSTRSNPALLEARFGAETVRVLETREVELTRAWDALTEAKGEGR